jgi:hypothetical protein
LKLTLKIAPLCLALLLTSVRGKAQETDSETTLTSNLTRTVDSSQVGLVFCNPNGVSWADVGARMGISSLLSYSAIKAAYVHAFAIKPSDQYGLKFPYSALQTFNAQEIAAGRAPIFVTATYQGKKRPVYQVWSLRLSGGKPTTSSSNWAHAINVGNERFVNFWVTKYVRPNLLTPVKYLGNIWFELDNSAFNYSLYGVLDDSNHFVAGVKWDEPFPQNDTEYVSAIGKFFYTLKATAPDIKTMPNMGSMKQPSLYKTALANAPGALAEDLYGWRLSPTSYALNNFYTQVFIPFSWLGSLGRPTVLGAYVPANNSQAVLTSFVVYELIKGVNSFFAPRVITTDQSVSASAWTTACTRLGNPVSTFQSKQMGSASYNRFFSRQYSGGFVYLNWTGSTQTVTLPTTHKWLDPYNRSVTRISIPNLTGTYVKVSY